jgi:hypothetical protein
MSSSFTPSLLNSPPVWTSESPPGPVSVPKTTRLSQRCSRPGTAAHQPADVRSRGDVSNSGQSAIGSARGEPCTIITFSFNTAHTSTCAARSHVLHTHKQTHAATAHTHAHAHTNAHAHTHAHARTQAHTHTRAEPLDFAAERVEVPPQQCFTKRRDRSIGRRDRPGFGSHRGGEGLVGRSVQGSAPAHSGSWLKHWQKTSYMFCSYLPGAFAASALRQ